VNKVKKLPGTISLKEALDRIAKIETELKTLKSMLSPPKTRKKVKRDYSKQINKSLLKTPQHFKKS